MKNYKLTLIGLTVSVLVLVGTLVFGIDLFELFVERLKGLEAYEADELLIPITIFVVFSFLDLANRHKAHADQEKIKIYKAMLSSAHHILNNFINQMTIVKMTAEDTPGFDPNALTIYDQIINDASEQIDALSSITDISEESIIMSVKPKIKQSDTYSKIKYTNQREGQSLGNCN